MRPIYTAFFTRGTLYESEAERLRVSLAQLGLEHDIRAIDSLGGWQANSGYTATHIRNVQRDHPDRTIVQLDADAVVWQYPWIFDELEAKGVDIAVHYRQGHELLNGTIWLAPTDAARKVIERYESLVREAGNNCHNEQKMLAAAIEEMGDALKVEKLSAGYCYIFDIMKNDLAKGECVTIEHLQASRCANGPGTEAHQRRVKRVAEIDGGSLRDEAEARDKEEAATTESPQAIG